MIYELLIAGAVAYLLLSRTLDYLETGRVETQEMQDLCICVDALRADVDVLIAKSPDLRKYDSRLSELEQRLAAQSLTRR
jgi:hypothetical protein